MTTTTTADRLKAATGQTTVTHETVAPSKPAPKPSNSKQTNDSEFLPYGGQLKPYDDLDDILTKRIAEGELRSLVNGNRPRDELEKHRYNRTISFLQGCLSGYHVNYRDLRSRYADPETIPKPSPVVKAKPVPKPKPTNLDHLAKAVEAAQAVVDDQRREFVIAMQEATASYDAKQHAEFLVSQGLSYSDVDADARNYRAAVAAMKLRADAKKLRAEAEGLTPQIRKAELRAKQERPRLEKAESRSNFLGPMSEKVERMRELREAQNSYHLANDEFVLLSEKQANLNKQADDFEGQADTRSPRVCESSKLAAPKNFTLLRQIDTTNKA